MAKPMKSIDITNTPELVRLAEEVQAAGEPYMLRRDDQPMVVVMPVTAASIPRPKPPAKRRLKPKKLTDRDIEAFFAAAGSWADMDTDRLIADIYADRRNSNRPPPEL